MADVKLMKPEAGQQVVISQVEDMRLELAFPTGDALMEKDGDNLAFTFEDGGRIVLENFYTTYTKEHLPEFVVEGQTIAGEEFFAALDSDLMPAAGPAAAGPPAGASRFANLANANLMNGLDRLGGLDIGFGRGAEEDSTLPGGTGDAGMAAGLLAQGAGFPAGSGTGSDAKDPGWVSEDKLKDALARLGSVQEEHSKTDYDNGAPIQIAGDFTHPITVELPPSIAPFCTVTVKEVGGVWGAWVSINAEQVNQLGIGEEIVTDASAVVRVAGQEVSLEKAVTITGTNANHDRLTIDDFSADAKDVQATNNHPDANGRTYKLDLTDEGGVSGINLGLGNDTLNVMGTFSGGVVRGGEGNDGIYAASVTGGTLDGGTGDDLMGIGSLSGTAYIDGGEGNDRVAISYSQAGTTTLASYNAGTAADANRVNPSIERVEVVDLGKGSDTITIDVMGQQGQTRADTLLITGEEKDTVNISHLQGGYVDAQWGDDAVNITTMTGGFVTGGEGADTITVTTATGTGSGLDNATHIDGNVGTDTIRITTLGDASGLNNVYVDGGAGDDNLRIETMYGGTVFGGNKQADKEPDAPLEGRDANTLYVGAMHGGTVNAGFGGDTVTIGAMSGGKVDGAEGADTFILTGDAAAYTGGAIVGGSGADKVAFGGKVNAQLVDS